MEEQRYQRPEGVVLERLLVLSATTVDDVSIQEDGFPAHVFLFLPEMGRSPRQPQHSCTPTGHLPCQLPPHLSPHAAANICPHVRPSSAKSQQTTPTYPTYSAVHLPPQPVTPTRAAFSPGYPSSPRRPPLIAVAFSPASLLSDFSGGPRLTAATPSTPRQASVEVTAQTLVPHLSLSSSATLGKDPSACGSVSPFVKRVQQQCLCPWVVVRIESSCLTPSPPPQPYATASAKGSTI